MYVYVGMRIHIAESNKALRGSSTERLLEGCQGANVICTADFSAFGRASLVGYVRDVKGDPG